MGLLIGVAFCLVLLLVMQLRSELRQLQEEPVDSLHWNVTQLELDVVRLEAEALLALANPTAGLAALRQRFDLFYSRARTVTEGAMFARLGLADTVAPMKARMLDFLETAAPLIDGADADLRVALPAMAQEVAALRQDMRTMAIKVIDTNAALEDARRASLGQILQQTAVAGVSVVSLLLGLLALVLAVNRQAVTRTEEVQRITSRLEATVGTALDAVIVAGMDGRIIDYNTAAETIFGYTRAEASGQLLSDLIVPARHRAAHDSGMERMRSTGLRRVVDAGRIKMHAMRKSGEEFPVELSIASSDGPDGILFIAYLRDISDSVAAETALVVARDEAQAAEQTKTSFIAVMSHEMRTPLNGVIGALEVLGRTPLQPRQERFLTLARTSAQQLLRHVNDVLDISRVDAGHAAVLEDRFDIVSLVASLVDPLRPAATDKGLRLDVRTLSDFPTLRGDPFRIGQVLQNFIANAIKFTDSGSITLEAELQRQDADTAEVEFRVTDTGIGIAPADLERIFQDFVMVDPSYGRSVGGTGLGLAISRRLAQAMGGEVGVESLPGEGSCFWFRLTLDCDGPVAAARPEPSATPPKTPFAPLHVLVVEDNETNRIVLEDMLLHLGHRVTLAVDGGEGVQLARTTRFDLILMDLSMPLMDGWTAASAIRLGGASQHSRILAVTAHARPERVDRMAEAGLDGWLTKPLTVRTLTEALAAAPSVAPETTAMPTTAEASLLNDDRLQELWQLAGQAGIRRLVERFQAEMDNALAAIDAAATTPLADQAALFHAGAGAAAVMGADRLRNLFAELEAACYAEDRAMLSGKRAALGPLCRATNSALTALI